MNKLNFWLPLLLGVLFFSTCASTGKLAKAGILINEGTDLYYEVDVGGQKRPFDINLNGFSDQTISFDWNMGDDKSGTVAMFDQALVNSTDMFNYFSGGYTELKDQTSVWISTGLFKSLKSGAPVEIGLGYGVKKSFKYNSKETYSFGDDGTGNPYEIPVFIVASEDGNQEIWIADDPQNRLIVLMVLDFRIELVNYKPY